MILYNLVVARVQIIAIFLSHIPGRKPIGVTATSELHELAVKKGVRIEFKVIYTNYHHKYQDDH